MEKYQYFQKGEHLETFFLAPFSDICEAALYLALKIRALFVLFPA